MKKGEIIFSAVCIAFFGFMLFETFELLGQGRPGEVGSGLWPFMALAVSTLLSVLMLISNIRKYKAAGPGAQELTAEAIAEKRRAADHGHAEHRVLSHLYHRDALDRLHHRDPSLHPCLRAGPGREKALGAGHLTRSDDGGDHGRLCEIHHDPISQGDRGIRRVQPSFLLAAEGC